MTKKFLSLAYTCLFVLAIGATTPALARNAFCLIKSSGLTDYRGKCDFVAERNGSFAVSATRTGHFIQNIDVVSVTILSKNRADVRGLTKKGINSRWGSASRSSKDRACWVGSDFKICVW